MAKTLSVCVVGCGSAGEMHLEAYRESSVPIDLYICDSNSELAEAMATQFQAKGTFHSYMQIVSHPEIDIVDICLPNYLHEEVGVNSLDAGKHVILEKPIATTVVGAIALIAHAQAAKRKLMVSHNYHFWSEYKKAKAIIDSGRLGTVFWIQLNAMGRFIPKTWRLNRVETGGGTLIEWGIHLVDTLNWLVEAKPLSVYARMHEETFAEMEGEDSAFVIVEYDTGLTGQINNGYGLVGAPQAFELVVAGTQGCMWLDENGLWLRSREKRKDPPERVCERTAYFSSVRGSILHFIDCVMSDTDPSVNPETAMESLRIVISAYRSALEREKIDIVNC